MVYHRAMDEAGRKIKDGNAGVDKDGRPLANVARKKRHAIQAEQASCRVFLRTNSLFLTAFFFWEGCRFDIVADGNNIAYFAPSYRVSYGGWSFSCYTLPPRINKTCCRLCSLCFFFESKPSDASPSCGRRGNRPTVRPAFVGAIKWPVEHLSHSKKKSASSSRIEHT